MPGVRRRFSKEFKVGTVKLVTGQGYSTANMPSSWMSTARAPEVAGQVRAGIRNFAHSMPAFRKIWQRGLDGELTDDLLREIQAFTGEGPDALAGRLGSHTHRFEGISGADDLLTTRGLETGLDRAGNALNWMSGMTPVNQMLQIGAARCAVQKFADAAFSGRMPSVRRLALIGLTKDDAQKIIGQIRKYSERTKGSLGVTFRRVNIDKWEDQAVAAKFLTGVNKWSSRVIQRNDPGQLAAWMTKDWGRAITQFRAFNLVSPEKQVLTGLYAADLQTVSSWTTSMFFGGLTYMTMQYGNSIGRTDRKSYLAKRLTPREIAKGAFQRAGWAAIFPGPIDTAVRLTGRDPVFQYGRTSGLKTDAFWGNPSTDTMDKLLKLGITIGSTVFNPDYRFSQDDARNVASLLPAWNVLAIQNLWLRGIEESPWPKYSQPRQRR